MKKVIPFTKEIDFNTPISEITDIEVMHNLTIKDNNCIEGDILLDGAYKKYEGTIDENFHYNLPFTIDVDNKYNITEATIIINDFYYEILDNILKINIELEIGNVIENEIREEPEANEIPIEIDEAYNSIEIENNEKEEQEFLEKINNNYEEQENIINNDTFNYNNMFDSISKEETFVTYHVYIFKENDKIEEILEKYNVTKDDLSLYNDISQITQGSKIIIPCHNE